MRRFLSLSLVTALYAGTLLEPSLAFPKSADLGGSPTATPIEHLVVIFQENVSFDHYFGTYPNALNPYGEPRFHAAHDTPAVNGLTSDLLHRNPNFLNKDNGQGAINPFRLDRSQAATADQDHAYDPEQMAFHAGLMDLFPKSTGNAESGTGPTATNGLVMGYYDGNTVTALWNYAQHFAMSDNSFGTTFGPSTPGALNLVAGQTNGVIANHNGSGDIVDGGNGSTTLISDADPIGDVCSTATGAQVTLGGTNIGDLLNNAGVSWGWFEGGFDLTAKNANGTTGCGRTTLSTITGSPTADYIPHHQPFQYYASTANPMHARPSSAAGIGHEGDGANHQYDINDFYAAVKANNFPAVSFLKAPGYQDGHAGYSDPLDEQQFLVHVINFLQSRPEWENTAVVIAYDDSDGWYDHQMPPIANQSSTLKDALTGTGACGNGETALPGIDPENDHAQGRCGFGPRLPLLVISPWSKTNYVSHVVTSQTSIIRFVEDNWLEHKRIGHGSFDAHTNSIGDMFDFRSEQRRDKLWLDGSTGEVQNGHGDR
jgi:phospholipase C